MKLISVVVPRHQQPGLQGPQPGDTRAVPCQTRSAPAGSDRPTAVHGWAGSQHGGASMEIYSRAEKAAGEKEKRTKGARNCTGNTKAREEEERRKRR